MNRSAMLCALVLLLVCGFALPAGAATPRVFLDAKDGKRLVIVRDGVTTPLPAEGFEVLPVKDAKLRYASFSDAGGKKYGLAGGVYLFGEPGAPASFLPFAEGDKVGNVRLSPGGTVLAVDAGNWLIRDWTFFSFPGLKRLGGRSVSYLGGEGSVGLIWVNENEVLFNSMDEISKRTCDYAPCGPISVMCFTLTAGKETPVFKGTLLCDYTLQSFSEGVVTAEKLCLNTVKEWKVFPENKPREKVTATLP